jgi:probable phosphoglycerate mutase
MPKAFSVVCHLEAVTREVILLRHARPMATSEHPRDWDLSVEGRKQAAAVAGEDLWRDVAVIYASPARKAVQTAEFISARWRIPVYFVDDLREVDRPREGSDFEGLLEGYLSGRTPPGWERPDQARARFLNSVRQLCQGPEEKVGIISHGTILTLFVAEVMGVEASYDRLRNLGYCDYAVLDCENWRIVRSFQGW